MEKDPLFHRDPASWPSIAEQRELAVKQNNAIIKYNFEDEVMENPMKMQKLSETLSQFDLAMGSRLGLSTRVFGNGVRALGTERHAKFYQGVKEMDMFGAFCLTEMAHGSNTQKMATTATYDPKSEEFVINSPNTEDM